MACETRAIEKVFYPALCLAVVALGCAAERPGSAQDAWARGLVLHMAVAETEGEEVAERAVDEFGEALDAGVEPLISWGDAWSWGPEDEHSYGARTLLYEVAVREDPSLRIGWSHLALVRLAQQDALHERAVAKLKELDPANALPWYIEAAIAEDEGDIARAYALVRKGNDCATCTHYAPPYPKDAHVRYPDLEPYASLGVAGEPVPASALSYLARHQFWMDLMWVGNELRPLAQGLMREGGEFREKGDHGSAIAYNNAALRLGLHVTGMQPADETSYLVGIAIAMSAFDELKRAYEAGGSRPDPERMHEFEQAFHAIRESLAGWMDARNAEAERERMRRVLLGESTIDEEWKHVSAILREIDRLRGEGTGPPAGLVPVGDA